MNENKLLTKYLVPDTAISEGACVWGQKRLDGEVMVYLSHFEFPARERECDFTMFQKRRCYDTYYPFLILSEHNLRMLDFEAVTILYGGNSCWQQDYYQR